MDNIFTLATQHTLKLLNNQPNKPHPTIILGLSGGPDSVFLFHVLAQLQAEGHLCLIAAHLDHEWRTSSLADAQFCTDLCHTAGVTLTCTKASELNFSIKFNGSKEDIGRRMRRHFFETVRQKYNANFIALAHHRQDQQETFFVRLLRGATLNGLTCMKPIDGNYLRPLLEVDKTSIIDYLTSHHLPFCIDPSNQTDTYLRNRIRKHVIPAIKNIDSRFEQKLESTITHLQEEDTYLQILAHETFAKIFTNPTLVGDLTAFKKLHPVMQHRVLLLWLIANHVSFTPSTAYLDELLRFINQEAGGRHCQGSWTIAKQGKTFRIEHPA